MIFRTISIEEEIDFNDLRHLSEKKLTAKIDSFLKNYVDKLLKEEVPKLLTGHPQQPVLPQIRVRVEYSDEKHQVNIFVLFLTVLAVYKLQLIDYCKKTIQEQLPFFNNIKYLVKH